MVYKTRQKPCAGSTLTCHYCKGRVGIGTEGLWAGACSKYCQLKMNRASQAEWDVYNQHLKQDKEDEIKYYQEKNRLDAKKQANAHEAWREEFEDLKQQPWTSATKKAAQGLINAFWYSNREFAHEIQDWKTAQGAIIKKKREKTKKSVYLLTEKKEKRRMRSWTLYVDGRKFKNRFTFEEKVCYEQAKAKLMVGVKLSGRYEWVWSKEKEQRTTGIYW